MSTLALAAFGSVPNISFASPLCDAGYVCYLDSTWTHQGMNNGVGTLLINDGNAYTVYGPTSMKTNITYPVRKAITLTDAWNNGWVSGLAAAVDPSTLGQIVFSNNYEGSATVVNDSGITETVNLYDPTKLITSSSASQTIVTILDPSVTNVDFYYDAGFVKVTDGEARVRLSGLDAITTGLSRNTAFALADGTGSTKAKIVWESDVVYEPIILKDDFSLTNTSGSQQVLSYTFKGAFTAFDGTPWTVNGLDDYKDYLAWLNDKVRDGSINSATKYETYKSAAYTQQAFDYDYLIPAGTGPAELYAAKNGDALLMAKGANATVEVAAGVTITQKTGPTSAVGNADYADNASVPYGVVLVTEGGQGHNYGTLRAHGGYGLVSSQGEGSRFTNESVGLIEIGSGSLTDDSGKNRTQTIVARDGGEVVNQGRIVHYGSNASTSDASVVFYVYNKGVLTNDGLISLGSTEKQWSNGGYQTIRSIGLTGSDSRFINTANGILQLGIDPEDGSSTGVGTNSFLLKLDTQNTPTTQSENHGKINAGSRVSGSNLIYAISTGINYFTNYGVINLDGNRDENGDLASNAVFNAAMYRSNSSSANPIDFENQGTINVDGYGNVALKAVTRGKIISSGTINVKGNRTSSGLNNYGAWVEGSGSLIEISGNVNLTGDDSIGVYATNRGTIKLSGNGQVTFADGENQIGYYIYGAGSAINNTGSGTQDVTTARSTLMRLDGGASFTGSASAASIMSASGEGSTVIVATGTGTTVSSGGMTVNVSGKDATGFLVEGGAKGTIDNTAIINLDGVGATAGIADGKKHSLSGEEQILTETEMRATELTAGATLTSTLNGAIGYIVRNLATLKNTGDITFTGVGATGIMVEEGATGVNDGNITLGENGVGLFASANTNTTSLTNTGNLTLNGDGAVGISATGSKVVVDMVSSGGSTPTIKMNGNNAVGVKASGGSVVNLDSSVVIEFSASATDQIAFWLSGKSDAGASSTVNVVASATPYSVSGERSTLFFVDGAANLSGALNVLVSGKDASGLRVSGTDSTATVNSGSQIEVTGENATGVLAQLGGSAIIASGAAFTVSGVSATVGIAEDDGSVITNGATVTSSVGSSGSTAFIARNGGELRNTGNIDLSAGSQNVAIDIFNGKVYNSGSIKANGTAIHIRGSGSVINNNGSIEATGGRAVIELGQDASLDLAAVSGSGTITAKGTADGILLSEGAIALNVSDTTIDMSDVSSTGVGIHNKAGISGIRLDNTTIRVNDGVGIYTGATLDASNSGTIAVRDGVGILYQNTNGTATANDLDLSGSQGLTINVNGNGGRGIVANMTGADKTVDSAVNVNILSASGSAALDVTGAATLIQRGDLVSASDDVIKAGNATAIINSGKIHAGSRTSNVVVMNDALNKSFTNTGNILGQLNFGAGVNVVQLKNGSAIDGDIALGSDDGNQITLSGASNSLTGNISGTGNGNRVSLQDGADVTGSVLLAGGNNRLTLSDSAVLTGNASTGSGNNEIYLSGSATLAGTLSVGSGANALTLSDASHLDNFTAVSGGENYVTVKDGATFQTLNAGTGGATDSLTFDNASYALTNVSSIQHFDRLNLINGALFTTALALQMGDGPSTLGVINVDSSSTLKLNSLAAYTLDHQLTGSGLLDVVSGTSFNFASTVGNQFTGTVQMNSDSFALSGTNTLALTNATLAVMNDNVTIVGIGTQNVGGLAFGGGMLDFGITIPNASVSRAFIRATDALDVSGSGSVKVNRSGFDNGTAPTVNATLGLLDQQNEALVQLVSSATVNGNAGAIRLIDENGAAISNGSVVAIGQNGTHAADATYDYRLVTDGSGGKGLYVGYGLTQVNLLTSGLTRLTIDASHSAEKTLSAKVTGTGDLGIKAGNGANALTIANEHNNYSGETDLQTGTLILGSNGALGETSKLSLANATTVNASGYSQTVGELNGSVGSTLDLGGGWLTMLNGGSSSGALSGSGQITVSGGTLTVNNANAGLSATTTVDAGAIALLKDVAALGTGGVVANGAVTLNNASGAFTNALSGSGTLESQNGSGVTLIGNNAGFSGEMRIDGLSSLTVNEGKNVGAASAIQNAGRFIVNNAADMTLPTLVNGVGSLVKNGAGTLTLSGSNTYSGDTLIQQGNVAISQSANLGDGSSTNRVVLDGGHLQITANTTSGRDVTLAKSGSVIVDSGVTATLNGWNDGGNAALAITKAGDGILIWNGDNSANAAAVNVTGGVLQVEALENLASATGVVNLLSGSALSVLKTGATADNLHFTRQLQGSGELRINLGDSDKAFTFDASAGGGDFSGTLTMNDGHFILDTQADSVMSNATLALNGGAGKLGSMKLQGNHLMAGLTLNGGRLEVDFRAADHRPDGFLTVDRLDASGGGSLAITTPANLPNPLPVTGASLFDQDDGVYDQIVAAALVNGSGSQISLVKADGSPVGLDTIVGLIQSGVTAGNAHYGYFGAVRDDGLYLGYGLTQLDAFANQSIILDNTNAVDNALGARLTGDGGFTVNAAGTVRIGNAASDYRGTTLVNLGSVVLITDNAFGQTSELLMQANVGVDLNGNAQTVGSLNSQSGSLLNLNGGELTVNQGGMTNGQMVGQGTLNLTGGVLNVTQNNAGLNAQVNVDAGATARLIQAQGLGLSAINLEGLLDLDGAGGSLNNALRGSGHVALNNAANVTLTADNAGFNGLFTTDVGSTLAASEKRQLGSASVNNDGTLILNAGGHWELENDIQGTGTLVKRGFGTVQIDGSNVTVGQTRVENGLLLIGSEPGSTANLVSDVFIDTQGIVGGYGTVTGEVENKGSISVGRAQSGSEYGGFTIDGDYVGSGGKVVFYTQLAGDGSSTDRLTIAGDTRGLTDVVVLNANGAGEKTENGIRLIEVGGNSDGVFKLSGRAVAGAYEYFLYQGGAATPDDGDWYLRSEIYSPTPDPSVYRPEGAGYMANMAAAGKLFSLRLEDREGRAENSSMWLRQVGSRTKHRDTSGQLHTATNSYVVQGGGEIWGTDFGDADRIGLGVMLAYGKANSKVRSTQTHYHAKSSIDGYSAGLYGSWYQDATTLNGLYVDSWAQYSWLDAEVNGEGMAKESYNMKGYSASLEAGYRMSVYQSANGEVFLTPQGQVTWNGIRPDDHWESNGKAYVTGSGKNNVQTRLGMKLSRDGVNDADKGADKLFTAYAEANWLYNSEQAGAVMDGVKIKQAGSRNVGELKLGAEGKLNGGLNLWSNVSQQLGDKGYSDTSVTLGIKYSF
ncbi:autotransporter [Leminorella grimontii]|uniref:Autotransporter n=3 Tax=Leminorella grimontii TaxID=82981 RepID=A0AAV5N141_9GAMM|nr:autotransporter [Leminorella grimontii]